MTTRILPWVAAALVLTCVGGYVACDIQRAREGSEASRQSIARSLAATADAEVEISKYQSQITATQAQLSSLSEKPTQLVVPQPSRRGWCEPLAPLYCENKDSVCPDMPDGTGRVCMRPRLRPGDDFACLPRFPPRELQTRRREQLREIAVSIRAQHPGKLGKYLGVIALRESTYRPWKRHRLSEDVLAAETAWGRRSEVFAGSPAHDEPWRWREGLGLYGQNPALWLDFWDVNAEPETLCGVVESTLAHLRGARKRWWRIAGGHPPECGGEAWGFTGPKEGELPSWYDLSLVNAGSNVCPAQPGDGERYAKRLSFETRARRVGLDPYAGVELRELGRAVAVEEQDAFAETVRAGFE